MAIGSDPEIGSEFIMGGFNSEADRLAWFEQMRSWGVDLLGGYGTLCFPSDVERRRINECFSYVEVDKLARQEYDTGIGHHLDGWRESNNVHIELKGDHRWPVN